MIRNNFDVT